VAALNSSNRVFNHLFEIGNSFNFFGIFSIISILAKAANSDTTTLLNICNAENHRPLHSSVIGNSYFIELLHK